MELKLPHQPATVKLHSLQGDAQAGGDSLVGHTGDEKKHLALPGLQAVQELADPAGLVLLSELLALLFKRLPDRRSDLLVSPGELFAKDAYLLVGPLKCSVRALVSLPAADGRAGWTGGNLPRLLEDCRHVSPEPLHRDSFVAACWSLILALTSRDGLATVSLHKGRLDEPALYRTAVSDF
jgi:hypothetical protein